MIVLSGLMIFLIVELVQLPQLEVEQNLIVLVAEDFLPVAEEEVPSVEEEEAPANLKEVA